MSRKYPVFLVATTVCMAIAVFFTLLEVLDTSIEREIIKRGDMAAQSFALSNGPLLLSLGSDSGAEKARLKFNVMALANDPDVLNARVADHRGRIVTSLSPEELGTALPAHFVDPDGPTVYADPGNHAYHFRATIRYGGVQLGSFVLSLSRAPLEMAVRRARDRALLFTVGIAAVICIFGVVAVQRELLPLKVMVAKLSAIAKGDFTERMPEERRDEIGELSIAFNRMLERAELFFHYVDKMVVDRLVADASLAQPGGRLRECVVLFGDMRGYTAMSNRRSANEVVRVVNTYFHLFIECIAHFHGIVDKTMGDAIMAVFERGDEESRYAHTCRSLRAMAYMKASSRVLNMVLRRGVPGTAALLIEPREFGFAMAKGLAIVGNIGSRRRMDFTVCGRVVNLASRLEGLSKHGEVIVDNYTRVETRDLGVLEPLPPVQPKGYRPEESVVPHRLCGLAEEEIPRLRAFMRRLFGFSFIQGVLMPPSLAPGEQRQWCDQVAAACEQAIARTPIEEFFALVDPETGETLAEAEIVVDAEEERPPGEEGPV